MKPQSSQPAPRNVKKEKKMNFGSEIETYKGKTIGVYGGKFYPFHKGHLACILKAQSQVDILFVIVQHDEEHERTLIEGKGFQHINHRIRERWITEELKSFPNIRVMSDYEPRSDNFMDDSRLETIYNNLNDLLGGINKVFSNEPEYTPYFQRYLPEAEHVVLFGGIPAVNIDATTIRSNLQKEWEFLPRTVQSWFTPRVAVCGIESAGKSHLSKMLAAHFQTVTVPEYGRLYYENLNGFTGIDLPSDYDDIVGGQLHSLNLAQKDANRVLIADTDLVYTQYFHIRQHGYKNMIVDAAIKSQSERIAHRLYIMPHNFYDLDGTRAPVEETQRWKDNQQLLDLYEDYGIPVTVIDEEDRTTRFDRALEAVKQILEG